ncbi:MAG: hypothetical protein J0L63_17350 [Anaerolineae bacterium]|nr:hypothetical protein [Anaerolineae bacterium]
METSSTRTWLTWGRLVALSLSCMLLGILLGSFIIGRFGFFAPPLLPYTVIFYLLLWLPIFLIGLFLHPHGSRRPLLLFIVLGAGIILFGLVLFGPTFNYTNGACQSAPLPDQPIRYECLSAPNYQNARASFILVGAQGSPFVHSDDSGSGN